MAAMREEKKMQTDIHNGYFYICFPYDTVSVHSNQSMIKLAVVVFREVKNIISTFKQQVLTIGSAVHQLIAPWSLSVTRTSVQTHALIYTTFSSYPTVLIPFLLF